MNNEKITILCSTVDKASQNIKNNLLKLIEWENIDIKNVDWEDLTAVHENEKFRIIEIDKHHIYQDRIDRKIESHGFYTHLIIVASKHKSADERSLLTAHFTGNPHRADFGGRERELSCPAPAALHSIIRNMKELSDDTDYEVNMESTHHGPSNICIPMLYAEVGSGEMQWSDPVAGEIVARSILQMENRNMPVAIGFGGGHYASRQTKLILETNVTFGHNFSNHMLEHLDENIISQAFEKSNANFAYFDRRSMNTKTREDLTKIVNECGYTILKENEIRELKRIPVELFMKIRSLSKIIQPKGKFKISNSFHFEIDKIKDDRENKIHSLEMITGDIGDKLLQQCILCDRTNTMKVLENFAPICIERENGTISNIIIGFKDKIEITLQDITNECIKILKEHYEIKYIPEDNKLHIIDAQFSPELAKNLGIHPGPMYGKLANKSSITIDGRTISPERVHVQKIKLIPLSNAVNKLKKESNIRFSFEGEKE
jgi:D-aminoacyl-tRNA deacylase